VDHFGRKPLDPSRAKIDTATKIERTRREIVNPTRTRRHYRLELDFRRALQRIRVGHRASLRGCIRRHRRRM
jgi:hypothetical protein